MTGASLPPMPSGLTPNWLTEALRETGLLAGDVAIEALEVRQVGEGVGMMSELSRLVPTYSGAAAGAPASFIAKYPSQNPTNRQIAMDFNLYEREVRYFAELDPLTTAVCPATYLTELDGDNFIILMEDLADYRVGDQIVGATLEETELAIDELAKLHAAFWEKVDGIAWIPHVCGSQHARNMQAGTVSGWEQMVSVFGDYLSAPVLAARADIQSSVAPLQAYLDRPPITLAHGDFRMENLLYGTAADHHPMAIIDWQGPLLGRGMQDVTLLLGQSTQTEVRRRHERALLERYVEGLAQLGVDGYGLDEAWQDYRHGQLYNWAYTTVVAGTLDAGNERAFAWMSQMIARQVAVTEDLGLLKLLPFAS
ncbi:MAG: DUF1679 domain-containing protein [Gammaproteobacteria bacterium]|nr:DUF1679 domain-containing protein [Gammaproteobacteria bacterium]MYF12555.1 DUF1679 domain-containing protein [Gammaproteobacteria bacterium]